MDKFIRQIFSFRGRSLRVEWWLTYLFFVVSVVVIVSVFFGMASGGFSATATLLVAGALLLPAAVILLLVSIRRLHDRDKSGHWLWLFYFGPNIIGGLGEALEDKVETLFLVFALICYLIALGILIWAIVVIGFLRGTSGPNRYGPDPLQST